MMLCSSSSSFANASAVNMFFLFELSGCIVLIVPNNCQIQRGFTQTQTFDNQLKINENISLILLNSLCHRLNNLGDFI